MDKQEELEMSLHHVREAKASVARQKQIVAELERDGHSTDTAIALLETLASKLPRSSLWVRSRTARLDSESGAGASKKCRLKR